MAKNNSKESERKKEKETSTISIKLEWIGIGLLLIFLIISLFTRGFSQLPYNLKLPFFDNILGAEALDEETVKEKVLAYINDELLQGQITAEITEITEDDSDPNLYKIKLIVSGQEYESFVAKDGSYLYIERYEITEPTPAEFPKSDNPEVLLFTMSYCPYGNQAEDFVKPVFDLLGTSTNIVPHYVIYNESYGYQGAEYCLDEENQYCSMHGIQELNQDVRELCAYKYEPDKFWDFVMAANSRCDSDNVDTCWEQVASDVGLNVDQIKSCQANEARDLLANEVALNQQYSVTGSPSIFINGQSYEGGRTPEEFKQAVCNAYNNPPAECDQTLDDTEGTTSGSCG
jgi:hypothetical protein